MGLHVHLSKEAQERLGERAAALGMKTEEYAAQILEGSAPAPTWKMSGVEILNYWKETGVLGSRMDIKDSVGHARRLRRNAERRRA